MKMIVIVDYGMGNLGSIQNMLKRIGADALISSDISEIEKADKLILPGVGSFDSAMKNLNNLGLTRILNKKVIEDKTPVLGICLGIQLFTKRSEEGNLPGLGWIDAGTIRFRFDKNQTKLKIPHMRWNTVKIRQESHLFKDMYNDARFYFVHSYHVVCNNASAIQKENIIGVQFHPEKSHKFGMKILQNFAELS
jgi:glutamine amidotransferase